MALAGKGRAGSWYGAVRYDSLGLNVKTFATLRFGFVMDRVDLGHRPMGAFLYHPTPFAASSPREPLVRFGQPIGRSFLFGFGISVRR